MNIFQINGVIRRSPTSNDIVDNNCILSAVSPEKRKFSNFSFLLRSSRPRCKIDGNKVKCDLNGVSILCSFICTKQPGTPPENRISGPLFEGKTHVWYQTCFVKRVEREPHSCSGATHLKTEFKKKNMLQVV